MQQFAEPYNLIPLLYEIKYSGNFLFKESHGCLRHQSSWFIWIKANIYEEWMRKLLFHLIIITTIWTQLKETSETEIWKRNEETNNLREEKKNDHTA